MAESQLIPLIQALGLNESVLDSSFTTPKGHNGVTFLAASGGYGIYGDYTINNDLTPTVEYPAASPNVVAVGGTTLRLNTQGVYPGTGSDGEIGWSTGSDTNSGFSPYAASGGGISEYESQPSYQENVPGTSSSGRTIPDVSFDADPNTGVAVCDLLADAQSDLGPWSNTIGNGTSLATPCWAGLIAIADQGRVAEGGTTLDGPSQTLPALYSLPSSDFHDITIGYNGYPPNGYSAGPGYDLVTGRGTPVANLLVPDLASYGMATHLVVTTQPPSSVIAGVGFHFTITAEDPYGNVATGFGGSVIATVTGASSGVTVTAVNGGAAYYVDVTTAGTYTFTATSSGLTSTTTTAFTVTPAAASQLVVTTQPPSSITAGSGFGLTIEAEDPYGNVATSFTGSVTIALGSNPGGSTLSGPTTVAASGGVAVFSGLSLNNLGVGYILQASGGGLTPVATTSFTVQAPPPQVQGRDRADLSEEKQQRQADRQARADRLPVHLQYRHEPSHHGLLGELPGADLRTGQGQGWKKICEGVGAPANQLHSELPVVKLCGAVAYRQAGVQVRRQDHPDRNGNQQRGRRLAGQQRRLQHLRRWT